MGYIYMTQKKVRVMDRVKAMELYAQGKTDEEIADECLVQPYTVRLWRKSMGLTSNKPAPKPKVKRKSNLAKLAAEAREHGMNYGQYTAMIREGQI